MLNLFQHLTKMSSLTNKHPSLRTQSAIRPRHCGLRPAISSPWICYFYVFICSLFFLSVQSKIATLPALCFGRNGGIVMFRWHCSTQCHLGTPASPWHGLRNSPPMLNASLCSCFAHLCLVIPNGSLYLASLFKTLRF